MTSRVTLVEISGPPSLNSARYVCVHAHFLSHSERFMLYSLTGFYEEWLRHSFSHNTRMY